MFDPMKHIKLGRGTISIDDHMLGVVHNIDAQVVDMVDDVIVRACVEAAKEAGITDLYLLDKTFVVDALKRAAGGGKWEDCGQYADGYLLECSACRSCLFCDDVCMPNYCPECGTRMDGENHGES